MADGYLCTPQNVETMIPDLKEIVEMFPALDNTTEREFTKIKKYVSEDDGTMSTVVWYTVVASDNVIRAQIRLIRKLIDICEFWTAM